MDRRDFLYGGVMATLVGRVLGDVTVAGAQAQPPVPPAGGPAVQGAAAAAVPAKRLQMDCYTRVLQWLRDPDEIAEAAIEMTFSGVEPTVTGGAGHIDPAKVTTELPAFVKIMEKHGLKVTQVRGGNQTSVDQPNLEPMVAERTLEAALATARLAAALWVPRPESTPEYHATMTTAA